MRLNSLLVTAAIGVVVTGLVSGVPVQAADFDPSTITVDSELAARVPDGVVEKGTLTVGSDTSYPPAEFLAGADGMTPQGIDVDLARGIAQLLGLKLNFVTADFDSILPAIGAKYDVGISAFTITNERYNAVDFVSYFNAGKQWAVRVGNPTNFDPNNVCAANVGVQTATTSEKIVKGLSDACVAAGKAAVNISAFAKQTDVITRLINGTIDATLNGSTNVGYAVKQTNGQLQTLGAITAPSPNGIAIKKGDTAWASLVADALNKLIADGDYAKILANWGSESAAVTKAEVDPAISE